uniref:RRM domain-containing protein n=1 Tax=Gossypium raimondii TaxID=29730 RepID=A0A0D2VFL8_GOSRA|nr:hypothetical protein B456_013G187700 [Gossypium raimondii]
MDSFRTFLKSLLVTPRKIQKLPPLKKKGKIFSSFSPNFASPRTLNPSLSTMSILPSSAIIPSSSSQFTYQTSANSSYFPLPFHLQQQAQPYAPSPQPVPVAPAPVYPAPVATVTGVYSLPQYHQAQQLFQRDAQIVTPEALESVKAALASCETEHKAETKKKAIPRKAAGQSWEDPTLAEWPENDFRLFCGDLGNEVNDDVLSKAFARFPSLTWPELLETNEQAKQRAMGLLALLTLLTSQLHLRR